MRGKPCISDEVVDHLGVRNSSALKVYVYRYRPSVYIYTRKCTETGNYS